TSRSRRSAASCAGCRTTATSPASATRATGAATSSRSPPRDARRCRRWTTRSRSRRSSGRRSPPRRPRSCAYCSSGCSPTCRCPTSGTRPEPSPLPSSVMDDTPPIFTQGADHEPHYRGRPMSDLLGRPFESVWGLLVDGVETPALPPAEPFPLPVRTGDSRVDVQCAIAQLAPVWGFRPLLDITPARAREDLARASVLALSFVAQSARSPDLPAVPQREVEQGASVAERFLIRWNGAAPPDHVQALDALWTVVAEGGE